MDKPGPPPAEHPVSPESRPWWIAPREIRESLTFEEWKMEQCARCGLPRSSNGGMCQSVPHVVYSPPHTPLRAWWDSAVTVSIALAIGLCIAAVFLFVLGATGVLLAKWITTTFGS